MEFAVKTDRIKQIRRTEETLMERHPALTDVIRPFAGLFRKKAELVQHLTEQLKEMDLPDRTEIPLALQLDGFPVPEATLAARETIAALKAVFPALAPDLASLETAADDVDFARLFREFLEKGTEAVTGCAGKHDLPADCLEMVTRLSLSALLEAMFTGQQIPEQDSRTHCPVCGSLPSISTLARAPEEQSEFLTGGGGMKFLHCGLCGHGFRTHRHLCPVCLTRDPEQLRYYSADKESGERVDACLNCNTYLPCIDLRKAEEIQDMETAATGLLHLEILAREKGFHPMTWTLWNRME